MHAAQRSCWGLSYKTHKSMSSHHVQLCMDVPHIVPTHPKPSVSDADPCICACMSTHMHVTSVPCRCCRSTTSMCTLPCKQNSSTEAASRPCTGGPAHGAPRPLTYNDSSVSRFSDKHIVTTIRSVGGVSSARLSRGCGRAMHSPEQNPHASAEQRAPYVSEGRQSTSAPDKAYTRIWELLAK